MLKYICDICDKEITDLNEHSVFERMELSWQLGKKLAEKVSKKTTLLLCKDCGEQVFNFAKECKKKISDNSQEKKSE